jgi:hypothetical protein
MMQRPSWTPVQLRQLDCHLLRSQLVYIRVHRADLCVIS